MNNSHRISWKYGVSLDGITRGTPTDEIKRIIVSNPKNARFASTINEFDAKYVRKAVGAVSGWYRKPRARRSITVTQPAVSYENTKQSRVTFMIAGCQITVPAGVSVEVI
jgi:hypothetical protein